MLFSKISEGGFLRTTPTQSPRTLRSSRSYRQVKISDAEDLPTSSTTRASSARTQARSRAAANENRQNSGHLQATSRAISKSSPPSERSTRDENLPPSILKKSRAESSTQLAKNTRLLSPTFESLRQTTSSGNDEVLVAFGSPFADVTTRGNGGKSIRREHPSQISKDSSSGENRPRPLPHEASPTEDKGSRTHDDNNQKLARKKPAFHAKTGASRKRPTITRRKSSQSSSSNVLNLTAPPPSSKRTLSQKEPIDVGPSSDEISHRKTSSTTISRSGSPYPLKNNAINIEDDLLSSDNDEEELSGEGSDSFQASLVDRDFRSKFAQKIRAEPRPVGSLHALEGKSGSAVGASGASPIVSATRLKLPKQNSGKSKRSVEFKDEIIPLKPPGVSGPEEDEDGAANLPRTKSQLTFLLTKDRQTEESDDKPKSSGGR